MVLTFPRKVRFSAIAIGYNGAQALFGGTAGIVGTLLFRLTGARLCLCLCLCLCLYVPYPRLSVSIQCKMLQYNIDLNPDP